jgi:hypothetical protein
MIAKPRRGTLGNTLRTAAWLAFALLFASLVIAAGIMIAAIVAGQARPNDLHTWADLGQACGAFSAIAAVAALGHCPLVKKFYTCLGRFDVTMVMV